MKGATPQTLANVEGQLDYDARVMERGHGDLFSKFFDSLSLTEWIAVFDAHAVAYSGSTILQDRERVFLTRFSSLLRMRWRVGKVIDAVRKGTSFRDLDVGPHGSWMLEEIGDLLRGNRWNFWNLLETDPERRFSRLAEGYRKVVVDPS
ncbi:hypothetical protein LTR10_007566 [Elasticomyces elasticus]|nr:hypothetical protein LTR10_007566 [Elasticomyces elasticus]